jgi:hypothetical protein
MKKSTITFIIDEIHNANCIDSAAGIYIEEVIIPIILRAKEIHQQEIKESYCKGMLDSEKFYNENYF